MKGTFIQKFLLLEAFTAALSSLTAATSTGDNAVVCYIVETDEYKIVAGLNSEGDPIVTTLTALPLSYTTQGNAAINDTIAATTTKNCLILDYGTHLADLAAAGYSKALINVSCAINCSIPAHEAGAVTAESYNYNNGNQSIIVASTQRAIAAGADTFTLAFSYSKIVSTGSAALDINKTVRITNGTDALLTISGQSNVINVTGIR